MENKPTKEKKTRISRTSKKTVKEPELETSQQLQERNSKTEANLEIEEKTPKTKKSKTVGTRTKLSKNKMLVEEKNVSTTEIKPDIVKAESVVKPEPVIAVAKPELAKPEPVIAVAKPDIVAKPNPVLAANNNAVGTISKPEFSKFREHPQVGKFRNHPQAGKLGNRPQGKFGNRPQAGKFGEKQSSSNQSLNAKKKKDKHNIPSKVKNLIKMNHLSARSAFKVFKGTWTLEQAMKDEQERVERRKKAEEMCQQNPSFNVSLACYLLKENISPEQFLEKKKEIAARHIGRRQEQKKKMGEDAAQKFAFETLVRFCQEKVPIELARYGLGFIEAVLNDFGPYEFFLSQGDRPFEIHRLKIKYFYEKRYSEQIKKWVVIDKAIQQKRIRPNYRPINRYEFPEGILQKGAEIMLALHEGEMIRGKIIWITPYDILLEANKAEIWVFRHAVAECALIRKPS